MKNKVVNIIIIVLLLIFFISIAGYLISNFNILDDDGLSNDLIKKNIDTELYLKYDDFSGKLHWNAPIKYKNEAYIYHLRHEYFIDDNSGWVISTYDNSYDIRNLLTNEFKTFVVYTIYNNVRYESSIDVFRNFLYNDEITFSININDWNYIPINLYVQDQNPELLWYKGKIYASEDNEIKLKVYYYGQQGGQDKYWIEISGNVYGYNVRFIDNQGLRYNQSSLVGTCSILLDDTEIFGTYSLNGFRWE